MSPHSQDSQRPSDEELAQIERRMNFENRSVMTVSKLGPAKLQTLKAQGFEILENKDGRLLLQRVTNGNVQQFLIVDESTPSFGVAKK